MIQDFCEEEWRKSRLEIDCAKGDGLNFIAPKGSRCNPFSSKSEGNAFCEHNHLYLYVNKIICVLSSMYF